MKNIPPPKKEASSPLLAPTNSTDLGRKCSVHLDVHPIYIPNKLSTFSEQSGYAVCQYVRIYDILVR